jgi:WD40 repeat protein
MERSVFTMQTKKFTDNEVYYVSFNPNKQFQFASSYGDGSVDIWDLRKTTAPSLSIKAHLKYV